ncbi:MAG: tetraacyldisaccharide 4'-kinase [Alphaproteobacteria bacterium]|nr:tetraacyldisaccharide 4'-kinase [Alphaproteobacteria bacterium]
MRTPAFWYEAPGTLASVLAPVAGLYALGAGLKRRLNQPQRATVPVICVGNLVAGGAGKTPVALALASLLEGHEVAFLTRGYGGSEAGPLRVEAYRHRADEVGDEALLLARAATTWVSGDRVAGAKAASEAGAEIIIMDDGFQNPSLIKDFSVIVADGATGFGNGRLVPAGPLREPVAEGFARADALVIIGEDKTSIAANLHPDFPVVGARLAPTPEAEFVSGKRVVAIAGIGRPQKFFTTLQEMGCTLAAHHAFADHHRYTVPEIMNICVEAAALDAIVVTTEKDWVRLPAHTKSMVQTVPVTLEWRDEDQMRALMAGVVTPLPSGEGLG